MVSVLLNLKTFQILMASLRWLYSRNCFVTVALNNIVDPDRTLAVRNKCFKTSIKITFDYQI